MTEHHTGGEIAPKAANGIPVVLDIVIEIIKLIVDLATSNFPVAGPIAEIIKALIDLIIKLI